MKDGKIKIEVNGEELEYDLIVDYEDEESQKHYYLYTDNQTDEDGELNIYGSYTEENNESLKPIESDEEWDRVDQILDELIDEEMSEEDEESDDDEEIETITLLDENGEEKEYELLLNFQSEVNDNSYIIYTDNETDENGNLNIYALRYDEDENLYSVDEDELKIIDDKIDSILDEE